MRNGKFLSEQEIIETMRARIGYKRTQNDLADKLGVSHSYLSELLAGKKKSPGPSILKALGYDPAPHYRKAK